MSEEINSFEESNLRSIFIEEPEYIYERVARFLAEGLSEENNPLTLAFLLVAMNQIADFSTRDLVRQRLEEIVKEFPEVPSNSSSQIRDCLVSAVIIKSGIYERADPILGLFEDYLRFASQQNYFSDARLMNFVEKANNSDISRANTIIRSMKSKWEGEGNLLGLSVYYSLYPSESSNYIANLTQTDLDSESIQSLSFIHRSLTLINTNESRALDIQVLDNLRGRLRQHFDVPNFAGNTITNIDLATWCYFVSETGHFKTFGVPIGYKDALLKQLTRIPKSDSFVVRKVNYTIVAFLAMLFVLSIAYIPLSNILEEIGLIITVGVLAVIAAGVLFAWTGEHDIKDLLKFSNRDKTHEK